MTVILDQFLQSLRESGLMAAQEMDAFLGSLPSEEKPSTGEDLAKALVKHRKLTRFQAQAVYQGKTKGLLVGNYLVLDKIGQGGMGYVYKAQHRRMKRVVALKVLPSAMAKIPGATERFQREVEAAAKLSHPNIVTAHDADESEGVHFLVMEYVEGKDLGALVRDHGPLSVGKALDYTLQAAKGLEYAHKNKVVHRDIKPSNLLLDSQGVVKVLDMGLARFQQEVGAEGTTAAASLTQSGQMMGTIDYMSPEQAMDTHHADQRSDIYSLGCTLFYLVMGQPVYAGETLTKKIMAHRDEPAPSLRASRQDVPEQLDAVFQRMVAKRPEDRWQSMSEVIGQLENCRQAHAATDTLSLSAGPTGGGKTGVSSAGAVASGDQWGAEVTPVYQWLGAELPISPTLLRAHTPRRPAFQIKRQHILIGSVAAGVVLLLVLLGVVLKVRTKDGTLVVTVNQPDAEVSVDNGKVTITSPGDKQPVQVQVAEGKHTLLVKKGGFETYTKEFSIRSGGKETIRAELVQKKPQIAAEPAKQAEPASSEPPAATPATGERPLPAISPFNAQQARAHQDAWAKHLGVPVEYTNSLGMKFILIPPGEFTMGNTPAEIEEALKVVARDDKHWQECIKSGAPQHKVILTQPIYLGVHEVTQAQYEKVMGQNPSHFAARGPGMDAVVGIDTSTHPVEMVRWNDVAEFCTKLSEKEKLKPFYLRAGESVKMLDGAGYRLTTEAEWEFACRAGATTRYWIGDKDDDLPQAGWFVVNSGNRTHAVGELKANPFGLFDIHGNVWEWVQDWWEPTYYGQFQEKSAINPNGPSSAGSHRVLRGGSWYDYASHCRASDRFALVPPDCGYQIGFRVALVVGVSRVGRP
jgi:formylglycine-generating enzyme required for sulfatase activity